MRDSDYKIDVLDLGDTEQSILAEIRQATPIHESLIGVVNDGPWGRIKVADKFYAIRYDGYGHEVTKDKPLTVENFPIFSNGATLTIPMVDYIIELPQFILWQAMETANFDDFIIQFMEPPQNFYEQWLEVFERPGRFTQPLETKEVTSIAGGAFFKRDWCECTSVKLAYKVKKNCVCTSKRSHSHCTVCGGIVQGSFKK